MRRYGRAHRTVLPQTVRPLSATPATLFESMEPAGLVVVSYSLKSQIGLYKILLRLPIGLSHHPAGTGLGGNTFSHSRLIHSARCRSDDTPMTHITRKRVASSLRRPTNMTPNGVPSASSLYGTEHCRVSPKDRIVAGLTYYREASGTRYPCWTSFVGPHHKIEAVIL